jgi:hypothetical protein
MRQLMGFCALLLLSGLAAGQVIVISGSANHWTPPGMYAAPSVPLVTTPSIALGTVFPSVGASNGTAENIAGATNATLSIDTAGPSAAFAQPRWYGTAAMPEVEVEAASEVRGSGEGFEFGAAVFQSSYGAAQLAAKAGPREHAARVYTNQDVEAVNHTNGLVKYRDKTEHVD